MFIQGIGEPFQWTDLLLFGDCSFLKQALYYYNNIQGALGNSLNYYMNTEANKSRSLDLGYNKYDPA